jgi:hypothetical protein
MSVRNCEELGLNFQLIINRLMANQNLLKLLYYTDKDPLSGQDLTQDQIKGEVFNNLIRITPRMLPQDNARSHIGLRIQNGIPNGENTEFRLVHFDFEVFTPMTQWMIANSNLRPFAIMGEIEKSLKNKRVKGLGTIKGNGFNAEFFSDEMTCYKLSFTLEIYD